MADRLRAACVVGWPVEHSRSPAIHRYWLDRYGIAGAYRREAVPPQDFSTFVRDLAARGYVGANVTLPHKEAALTLCEPDERAGAVGAANTLWFEHGRLRCTNTDVEGFLDSLDEAAPGWDAGLQRAVVVGAGGAARAVVYGLVERGVGGIHVVNRTAARAQELARRFGPRVQAAPWEALPQTLRGAGLLANASSLGMEGHPDLQLDLTPLRAGAAVADAVYVPLETSLLRAAKARGLRTADGLGMLLHQAGRGFALWFGVRPEVTRELRGILEAELAGSPADKTDRGGDSR